MLLIEITEVGNTKSHEDVVRVEDADYHLEDVKHDAVPVNLLGPEIKNH